MRPATKKLLLDVGLTGVTPANLEGMTWGPPAPDGRPTLLLLADDNFGYPLQRSQLLAYALDPRGTTVPEIQGKGHRSPFVGSWVRGVVGTITAVRSDRSRASEGFWIQAESDGDPATSDAVYVGWDGPVAEGHRVRLDGAVREREREGELSVTWIAASEVERLAEAPLPPPVPVSAVPGVVDDDGMTAFEPSADAIDFLREPRGHARAAAGVEGRRSHTSPTARSRSSSKAPSRTGIRPVPEGSCSRRTIRIPSAGCSARRVPGPLPTPVWAIASRTR